MRRRNRGGGFLSSAGTAPTRDEYPSCTKGMIAMMDDSVVPSEPEPLYDLNTSGTDGPLPPEIDRMTFNLGAFFGGFVWAIGNRTWVGLIDLIGYLLIPIMPIWRLLMGLRGSEWAWRARKWNSVAQFQRAQRLWAWVGGLILVAQLTVLVVVFVQSGSFPLAGTGGG